MYIKIFLDVHKKGGERAVSQSSGITATDRAHLSSPPVQIASADVQSGPPLLHSHNKNTVFGQIISHQDEQLTK